MDIISISHNYVVEHMDEYKTLKSEKVDSYMQK